METLVFIILLIFIASWLQQRTEQIEEELERRKKETWQDALLNENETSNTKKKPFNKPDKQNKPSKPSNPINPSPDSSEPAYKLPVYLEPGFRERKAEYLKSKKWNKKRKSRLKYDNYTCQVCKHNGTAISEPLQVHHLHYRTTFNENVRRDLVSLCSKHHSEIHQLLGYDYSDEFPIDILYKDKK